MEITTQEVAELKARILPLRTAFNFCVLVWARQRQIHVNRNSPFFSDFEAVIRHTAKDYAEFCEISWYQ